MPVESPIIAILDPEAECMHTGLKQLKVDGTLEWGDNHIKKIRTREGIYLCREIFRS
jgi:hypothetical protein